MCIKVGVFFPKKIQWEDEIISKYKLVIKDNL
jgi:hypothetical protein